MAIISACPLKCGVTWLAWPGNTGGDEVLHRTRAAGELQGAGGCGVRACVVGKWAEGMEGKCLHEALWSKKRFCVFHQEFHLPSGLCYTTSCQTELFKRKENTGSFFLLMIKREMHKVTQSTWLKPNIPPSKCLSWKLFLNGRSFVQLYPGFAWEKGGINNPREAREDMVSAAGSIKQNRSIGQREGEMDTLSAN